MSPHLPLRRRATPPLSSTSRFRTTRRCLKSQGRLRETIERSLGALLVSRRVRNTGGCQELAAILDGWDGHFNVLMRKRISRHVESCDICDEERRRLVTPAALLGAAPVFIPAPEWLRERTLSEIQLTSAASPMGDDRPEVRGMATDSCCRWHCSSRR
jgi:hypothetical protein